MSALESVKDLTAKAKALLEENAAKAKTLVEENAAKAKTVVAESKPKFDAAVDKAASFVDEKTKGKYADQVSKVQDVAKKVVPSV